MDSRPIDFVDIFLDNEFWHNLTNKTQLRATQLKETIPEKYICKHWPELTVEILSSKGSEVRNQLQ